jgi:hypothetical protein
MDSNQKAVVMKPTFGGVTSLDTQDLADLNSALADGWKVNQIAVSTNGAILVILEKQAG